MENDAIAPVVHQYLYVIYVDFIKVHLPQNVIYLMQEHQFERALKAPSFSDQCSVLIFVGSHSHVAFIIRAAVHCSLCVSS